MLNIHRNSVFLLVLAVIGLIALGLVMLSSTAAYAPESKPKVGSPGQTQSAPRSLAADYASESQRQAKAMLRKQFVALVIGATLCVAAAILNYSLLARTWALWFAMAVVLLALCYVHGIGHEVNGAKRWLRYGGIQIQPSELGKLAVVIVLAWRFSFGARRGAEAETVPAEHTFLRGFLYPLLGVGVIIGLIAKEVDMGTTILLGATTVVLMFIAGVRLRFLLPMVLIGAAGLAFVLMKSDEHRGRMLAFLWPETYKDDWYQQDQGLIALGSGGVWGLGLGLGRQKMNFLPFPHTDFILPVVGEELGLVTTLCVVLGFLLILLSGTVIAVRAHDRFGLLLGFGIVLLLALQAAINIGVTTGVMPNKGMPLPFLSYGGSNLVFCLLCVGILISIWRRGISDHEEKANVRLSARVQRRPRRI